MVLVAIVAPSQASAASSSTIVKLPSPCPAVLADSLDESFQLVAFCTQIRDARGKANHWYGLHYKASTRRKIVRAVTSESRRLLSSTDARGIASARDFPDFPKLPKFSIPVDDIKDFMKKSLKKVKKVAKGAIKVIPQAKVLSCAFSATLTGAQSYISDKRMGKALVAAAVACIGVVGGILIGEHFPGKPK